MEHQTQSYHASEKVVINSKGINYIIFRIVALQSIAGMGRKIAIINKQHEVQVPIGR